MPIRPENKHRYPENWQEISRAIKERAGWRCECEGECGREHEGRCTNYHDVPSVLTGNKVVLTTAHLDHVPEHVDPANLRAFCQACHLSYDREHHAETRALTRTREQEAAGQGELFGRAEVA
jgi:5-methylcytosine-specific restriction endonuclease McrA